MSTRSLATCVVFLGVSAGTALAQPLYVGSEEIDTADQDAVAMLLEHCLALGEAAPDAQIVSQFTSPASQAGEEPAEEETDDVAAANDTAETQPVIGDEPPQDLSPTPAPEPEPEADTAEPAPAPEPEIETETAEPAMGPMPLSLEVAAVASSGDDSEPAGEGAGEGTDANQDERGGENGGNGENGGENGEETDFSAIALEDCKEAGLLF